MTDQDPPDNDATSLGNAEHELLEALDKMITAAASISTALALVRAILRRRTGQP
jgi:hypothetical protein